MLVAGGYGGTSAGTGTGTGWHLPGFYSLATADVDAAVSSSWTVPTPVEPVFLVSNRLVKDEDGQVKGATVRDTITNGGPAGRSNMPAWGSNMSSEEIDDVIAWFQSLWPDPIYEAWYGIELRTRQRQ